MLGVRRSLRVSTEALAPSQNATKPCCFMSHDWKVKCCCITIWVARSGVSFCEWNVVRCSRRALLCTSLMVYSRCKSGMQAAVGARARQVQEKAASL